VSTTQRIHGNSSQLTSRYRVCLFLSVIKQLVTDAHIVYMHSFISSEVVTQLHIYLRPMSHLQFYRAILSHNFIARQSCSMQLCMPYTATFLSHKQELTNQRLPHSRVLATEFHRIERCSIWKRSCATVKELRDTPCYTCDFVAL